jgi:hypothetical protein
MKNEFIPYEQAVELKELGFDEPCLAFYNGKFLQSTDYDFDEGISRDIGLCCKTPTFSQAFRWFREKHGLVGIIKFGTNDFTYNVYNEDGMGLLTKESLNFNGNYEETELACLKKLIEIVNTKEK